MTSHSGITLLLCFLLASFGLCKAQNLEAQFDALMTAQFPSTEPGAVALVAKGGQIIYHSAIGKANLELDVAMRTNMVFRLGSITKQFTAVSVLMLMEQGKLSLDDPISKHISDYPTHGHNITIHHLLTHTSGIANSTTLNPWDADVRKRDFSPKELIDYFKNEPMRSAPGDRYRYNNFGYHILGLIIENITGQSYAEFISDQIFKPLKMNSTHYDSPTNIVRNRAAGHTRSTSGFQNAEYISMTQPYAAGSLMSTTEDLLIWHRALISHQLIKEASLKLAWSNYELNDATKINYGYGWFVNEVNGSPTFEHAGGIAGFQTNAIYLPEEDIFVAVFSNCDATDPRPVSTRMAALAIGKPYPTADNVVKLTDAQLQKWTGQYSYPDGSTRIVELKDHWLYWSRPGRKKFKLLPSAPDRFVLENTFTQVEFKETGDSVKAFITARIVSREAVRISPETN